MPVRLFRYFAEAPDAPRLTDSAAIESRYRSGRRQVLLASMAGYGFFYFCRNDISVALPLLGADLHYSNSELGILGSLLYGTYGVAKFASGLIADRAHPRRFLIVGLLLSALANVAFGFSSSLVIFCLIWALNGVFQSTGAPASAKILATWFGAAERGTKTGIWNISHQAGGGLALIIAGAFAHLFGWRGAFIGPALLSLGGGLLIVRYLRDRPEAEGLPPVDQYRGEVQAHGDDDPTASVGRMLLRQVLLNRRVWIVALASCFTYVVRYGALLWAPKYLSEYRHFPSMHASVMTSLLEFVGIPGALLCGWLSDRYFNARRAPVVVASLLLLGGSIWLLFRLPSNSPYLDALLLALVGFFTYGPQMLLAGVSPVDMSSRRVAAAAVGFTGLMSYAGATISSLVTGHLLDVAGWEMAFSFWVVAALLAAVFCMPLWHESAVKRRAAPSGALPARASAS